MLEWIYNELKISQVEIRLDFPNDDYVPIQKMYLVPGGHELLSLKEGDIVDYERGITKWSNQGKEHIVREQRKSQRLLLLRIPMN